MIRSGEVLPAVRDIIPSYSIPIPESNTSYLNNFCAVGLPIDQTSPLVENSHSPAGLPIKMA